MNKFLTIAMLLVIMSLLSCGSGIISVLAAAVLPFFTILGVGLMTLNVLVANGQNQNALADGQNAPAAVLGEFMDVMFVYCAKFARGLFYGLGKMIGWGMPAEIIGPRAAPAAPPVVPSPADRCDNNSSRPLKVKVRIYLPRNSKDKKEGRSASVSDVYRSRGAKVSVS